MEHRLAHDIPDGDILLHAGDITRNGLPRDLEALDRFFESLPHKHKIFTPGNHDWCFEKNPERAAAMVPHATCLIDQSVKVAGIRIWGSPWQPEYHDWAFNLPRGQALAEKWALIPEHTDIVITHGPVRGIRDLCSHGGHEGCDDLRDRLQEVKPRLHVCGHIHEAYGVEKVGETTYINASICDQGYKPSRAPLVFDW